MKQLILVPIGGLANRIYAITSAIAFCKDYDIKLKVIWFKDKGMGADFHSLFELSENVDKSMVEIVDAKWYHYIYDRPRKRTVWIPYLFQKILFTKRIYEKDIYRSKGGTFSLESLKIAISKCKSIYLVQCDCFYSKIGMFQFLRPVHPIQESIINRKRLMGVDENMIGVHIRRTDHISSIKNSPLSLFVAKMKEEILKNSMVRFYIASDDCNEKLKLKKIFGDRIVMVFNEIRRDDEQGINDAIVELYTLASMKKIYGSCNSTYSQLAAQLFGIKLEILSIR